MESEASVGPARVRADEFEGFEKLLAELGIERISGPSDSVFLIGFRDGALDLRPPGELDRAGIQPSFPPDRGGPGEAGRKKNPLLRAFGSRIDTVFDLTAGLGGDAYRLAAAGHSVRAFERDAAIYALLATAWQRDCEAGRIPASVAKRLVFEWIDGEAALDRIDGYDVGVYIDPMYPPPRKRSAKPRRELQVMRQLLGHTGDAAPLVAAARERAARVVVKRPHHAAALVPGATFEIESKLVRFDVYVNPARMSTASGGSEAGREVGGVSK